MQPKKIFITWAVLLGIFLLVAGMFMGGTKITNALDTEGLPGINMNQELVFNGDDVSFEDSKVSIVVSPAVSNKPVISFISKVYSGEVDIVVGFNTSEVIPISAEFNPHLENVEKSYTCDGEDMSFNYIVY